MNLRHKKILIIALPLMALLIAVMVTLMYNQGFFGRRGYGYSRGEGRRVERFTENGRIGRRFHHRHGGGMHNPGGYGIFIALSVFIVIVGGYLVIRNITDGNEKKRTEKCTQCSSPVEKEWITCPFCGHRL